MTSFLIKWAVSAISLAVAAKLIKGINIDSGWTLLIAALVIGLLNATLRWFLIILTLPINILTLGLFTFLINALMLKIASGIIPADTVITKSYNVVLPTAWTWNVDNCYVVAFIYNATTNVVVQAEEKKIK